MRSMSRVLLLSALCLSWAAPSEAKELVVAQAVPLSTPSSLVGNEMQAGIELYFQAVNHAGGVQGNTLKLVSRDRGIDPRKSSKFTRDLINEVHPIALCGLMGTGVMETLLKDRVLENTGVPVIGIRSGAASLRQPFNPLLFHTRPSYATEAQKIVKHLASIGYRRIGVVYEESSFGKEALGHITRALAEQKVPLVVKASYPPQTARVQAAVDTISKGAPDVVIAAGDSDAVAEFYKGINGTMGRMPLVALSTVDAVAVVKRIGVERAQGLGVVLVVPDATSRRTALAREFQDDLHKYGGPRQQPTQAMLEGYATAKVLVEGLRHAGPDPTSAKLKSALETVRSFDMGGVIVGFTPTDHAGSTYVDIGIVGHDGRVLH